jgi:hypothetical protein
VILVDDGMATGSTMRAAVEAVRTHRPVRIVVAVPVAAPDACAVIRTIADLPFLPAERGRMVRGLFANRGSGRAQSARAGNAYPAGGFATECTAGPCITSSGTAHGP